MQLGYKWISYVFAVGCITLFSSSYAAPSISPSTLPGTVQPGVISNTLSQELRKPTKKAIQPVMPKQQEESPLGKQAEHIQFKLTKIILEGNVVYTNKQLESIYKDKLNKIISVADLFKIVQSITNYYRNNGYILSRAILPPQQVKSGEVRVRILEGFIDKVKIAGASYRTEEIVALYTRDLPSYKPLKIDSLEYRLRLVNQIPGVQVKAVLEPSKKTLAAATLNLVIEEKMASGFISYDNYGSRYVGPNEVTVSGTLNSMLRSGDSTRGSYITTSRPGQLKYGDLSHSTPIGSSGLRAILDMNQSRTQPGMNLRVLNIEGQSNDYSGFLEYPMVLTRATDVTVRGGFDYMDSGVNTFGATLYQDHLRSLQLGADVNHADRFGGTNNLNGYVRQGLDILGATTDETSTQTSRFGGVGTYTKFDLQMSRLQSLGARYAVYLLAKGQYAFNPLLASEQFAFGGSQLGRGYDAADIIGDMGAAGSAELRMNMNPQLPFLSFLQPYVFYDIGAIWNRKNISGSNLKQSESSTGFGMRILFNQYVSGNFMIGQPLTKQDSAEQLVGNGRRPRGLFSVVVSG